MRIRLDDEELSLSSDIMEGGRRGIFDAARQMATTNGRVITEVIVDGESLDDMESFCELSSGQDVQFKSQVIGSLVRESIAEGRSYLPNLLNGLAVVASKFEAGSVEEARTLMAQGVEGINWLVSVFDRCTGFLGFTDSSFTSGDFPADVTAIKEAMGDMVKAMEAGQDKKMAFVIRDALLPALERFSAYWDEVARTLDTPMQ